MYLCGTVVYEEREKTEMSDETYTSSGETNAHGASTLGTPGANAAAHVVAYAPDGRRERRDALSAGTSVQMEHVRTRTRGNGWRADGVSVRSESPEEAAAGG